MSKKKPDADTQEILDRIMLLSCRENRPKIPWNPSVYLALCCGDIIWSNYPGHFRSCECGSSFVDETRHYGRLGGDQCPELLVPGDQNHD